MIEDTTKNRLLLLIFGLSIPIGIGYCLISSDWSWMLVTALCFQFVKVVSNNIALHRYFSHKSFQTDQTRHRFLAIASILAGAKSPLQFAMNHRHHHKFSDQVNDTHNPNRDFWSTLFGLWEFQNYQWFKNKGVAFNIKDLMRDPLLIWIDKHYYKIWSIIVVASFLISWHITIFVFLMPAGWFHVTANFFNTVGHFKFPFSYRNFDTDDLSQNNWLLAVLTFGEGWHNNHHQDQTKFHNKVNWWEFDPSGWIIKNFFVTKT